MQAVYIDLHIHTSDNANSLNENYDIAELVSQIKNYVGDVPFMISLTDHNVINKSAYLKAKNLNINLILGVELHIKIEKTQSLITVTSILIVQLTKM